MSEIKSLKENDSAPEFNLADQNGKLWSLKDFKGKYLLIYFYPKDFTPGCTKEACNFRDAFPRISSNKFTMIGVSTDSSESHKKFADKYQLPFTLLADTDKKMVTDYGVWQPKKFMGREFLGTIRTSFLINPQGIIEKIYPKVNPITHIKEVEEDINRI